MAVKNYKDRPTHFDGRAPMPGELDRLEATFKAYSPELYAQIVAKAKLSVVTQPTAAAATIPAIVNALAASTPKATNPVAIPAATGAAEGRDPYTVTPSAIKARGVARPNSYADWKAKQDASGKKLADYVKVPTDNTTNPAKRPS